ncbi:MAG TPA: hypothetical protein VF458_11030 [Ktedonobacteraceae bacterium]
MGTVHLFISYWFTSSRRTVQWISLVLAAFVLCSGLFGLAAPVLANPQSHGCAPAVPPSVANTIPLQDAAGSIWINEILLNPASNWNCSEPNKIYSSQSDSWIEFLNPQNQAFDLYAAHAQISLDGGSTFIFFPFGTTIAANGFLVVFPQYNQTVAASTPWNVILRVGGAIIDQVKAPVLQSDQSYERIPDGSTTWLYSGHPTIDASNNAMNQTVTPTATKKPVTTGSPTSGATNQPASSGTQPTWRKVQFPASSTPAPDLTTTVDSSTLAFHPPQNPPVPSGNGSGGWVIALTVFLALLFLISLIWCWRLFHAP